LKWKDYVMAQAEKRAAALVALQAYAEEIRTKIACQTRELESELARVEQAIAGLAGAALDPAAPAPDVSAPAEYAGLGPQRAVEKFLREHPGQLFLPSTIAREIRSRGFAVSNPRLANQQVTIALIRASRKGVAAEGLLEGRRAFRLNA
jgi:hypothetical protein